MSKANADIVTMPHISQSLPLSPKALTRKLNNSVQDSQMQGIEPDQVPQSGYMFDVGTGNNGSLVSTLLKARGNWREV